jgi:hypothetical protein
MRLISLDFDGPLHPVSAIADKITSVTRMELDRMAEERNLFRWLPDLVHLLAAHPDVNIAVHSNWRKYASNSQIMHYLGDLAPRFVGITSIDLPRQMGIEVLAERAHVEHLLVIDDDNSQFDPGYEALLLVDPEEGIAAAAVHDALDAWLRETSPVQAVAARP